MWIRLASYVSKEIIKPSSPTPKSLQKHQLSFLDQRAPSFFMPIVYFYSSNQKISNSQKSKHLKNSLSETLSIYYPLAGRLVGNLHVDCNDSGVPFVEAMADCDISQVVNNPDTNSINKHLIHKLDESQDLCLSVQATYFRCGGLTLGINMSHKIADGLSLLVFARTWSTVAGNGYGGGVPAIKFDAATYFPPMDNPGFNTRVQSTQEELATKIFTFSAERIASLHERYANGGGDVPEKRPSRLETVSAYIWTRFLSSTGMQADPEKTCTFLRAVNLRGWVDPPMSEYNFGNIVTMSEYILGNNSKPAARDGGVELLRKVGEAKKAVYGDMAMNVLDEMMTEAEKSKHISFTFSSLCGFPMYEANLGWGKPIWVVVPGLPVKNLVIFTDAKSGGGGIEALVHLSKQDMKKFEADFNMQLLKSI